MWKQIIVWGIAILLGHQRVVYQLVTCHETLTKQKNNMSFSQVLQFVQGDFENKMLSRVTLDQCFDASLIMQDRVGEYGLEGNIWVMAQHEES